MKYFIVYLLALCASSYSRASKDMYILHLPAGNQTVQDHIMVLDTVGEGTPFDSIRDIPIGAYRPFRDIIPHLERNKSYWLRLHIKNTVDETRIYYFETGLTQEIDLYEPNSLGKYHVKQYGYSVPDGHKEYAELAAEVVGIKLHPQEDKVVYFRIKSELNLKPSPLFKVKERNQYLKHIQIFNFLQGLYHGLIWMMVAYVFFMYINIRDRAYLYYIIYATSFSVALATLIGYPRFYMFRDSVFNVLNSEILLQVSSLFVILLFRKVMNVKEISPRWTLFYNVALCISVAGIIVTGIFIFIDFYLYNLISQISVLCSLVFYLIIIIGLFRFKTPVTIYYFFGNLALTIGSLIITVALLFFGKPFLDYFPIFQFTAVIEAVCFAMGLSKRFQKIEREKREAQIEYIHELKEKEALQMQINEDLEEIVNERTIEIRRSKHELEIQRSNLAMKHILLEESNRTLTENLEYAGFMQKALLDDFEPMKDIFSDAFLLYRPYSFVSGDFYMFFELNDGKYIIVAADCTGHGVPGAMLTFIAQGFIQDLVNRNKVFCPSELLHQLEDRICSRLLSATSGRSLREGLDASVVYIDTFIRQIDFAGARMPLYLYRRGDMLRVKGSRHGIGGGASEHMREQVFEKHSFNYQSGDIFFMATDGFTDQLDRSGKKFLVSRFTDLLSQIAHKPCDEQKQILRYQLNTWKSNAGQTDDILVMGVRLK